MIILSNNYKLSSGGSRIFFFGRSQNFSFLFFKYDLKFDLIPYKYNITSKGEAGS